MPEMHLQNFEKLQSRKLLVKYSACAECEIIHFVNCEILLPQVAMWNEICPHSRNEYFTRRRRISHFAEIFHLPTRANFVEKSTCLRKCFFLAGVAGFEPAKMPESKSGALPLGYTPIFDWPLVLYHILLPVSRTFLQFCNLFLALFLRLLRVYIIFTSQTQNLGKNFYLFRLDILPRIVYDYNRNF